MMQPAPAGAPVRASAAAGQASGAPPGAMARMGGYVRRLPERLDFQQKLLYFSWFLILMDPQWMLAEVFKLRPLLRLPSVLQLFIAMAIFNKPQGDWLAPVGAWTLLMGVSRVFAFNPTEAQIAFRLTLFLYLIGLGLIRAIRTPRQASMILFLLCVGQYLWWGGLGLKSGLVYWHPSLANSDGFGPCMVIGVGMAYFYSTATPDPKRKRLALIATGLCIGGTVSAFARGAVLSMVAVIGYIWLRSPRKGRTTGFIAVAAVVVGIAGFFVDPSSRGSKASNFWEEMMSSFNSEDDTGNDRKVLWGLATQVFYHHPILGAGTGSFGAGAVDLFQSGQLGKVGGDYALNPLTLYQRALHNIYYQMASENGIIGLAIFAWMLIDFWKRNRQLNTDAAQARWSAGGGTEDLRRLAIGLECGMVAFLATGYFYNQLLNVWLWALLFANATLHYIVFVRLRHIPVPPPPAPKRGAASTQRRPVVGRR